MSRWIGVVVVLGLSAAWVLTGPEGMNWLRQTIPSLGADERPRADWQAVAETEPPTVVAEGRVVAYPGAEVVVGTEVAGRIVRLDVTEKSLVKRGQLIAELNADELQAERDEAEARKQEAEADVRHAERELQRERMLNRRQASTDQTVDRWRHELERSQARRALAEATLSRLDAQIAKTRIVAPIDGVVTVRHADPGETVEASASLVTIVDLNRLRIEAEVDELDIPRVVLGAETAVSAEGFQDAWEGVVEELPDVVTGRRMRPEDPGRPIDARILPVKIALSGSSPLKLGQRVDLRIQVRKPEPRNPEVAWNGYDR